MDIKGKINFFVNEKTIAVNGEEKAIKEYSGSLSKKQEDGSYLNAYIGIKFAGEKFTEDKLNKLKTDICYSMEVKAGFISFRQYQVEGKTRTAYELVVTDATILDSKEVSKPLVQAPTKTTAKKQAF